MKYVKLFLLVLAAQLVLFPVIYYFLPSHRYLFEGEDQLIENLSALFFLFAGVFGLWLFIQLVSYRKMLLLIATLGFVGFMDEISFGERLFGYSMPSLRGWKVDGVHDLVERALRFLLKSAPATTIVLCSLAVGAFLYRKKLFNLVSLVKQHPPYLALSAFVVLISVAILLDAKVVLSREFRFAEELLEMNAALSLILVCLCIYEADPKPAMRKLSS